MDDITMSCFFHLSGDGLWTLCEVIPVPSPFPSHLPPVASSSSSSLSCHCRHRDVMCAHSICQKHSSVFMSAQVLEYLPIFVSRNVCVCGILKQHEATSRVQNTKNECSREKGSWCSNGSTAMQNAIAAQAIARALHQGNLRTS